MYHLWYLSVHSVTVYFGCTLFRDSFSFNLQKQPFANGFQNKCFLKIFQISQENTLLESLFNKVAGLGLQLYWKETPAQVFSCQIWEIFSPYAFGGYFWIKVIFFSLWQVQLNFVIIINFRSLQAFSLVEISRFPL